jgi:hypothetical protein
LLTFVNGALILLIALAIVGVQVVDRPAAAVEASARRYAAAISAADLAGAMDEIAPEDRAAWNDWVQGQLGNTYVVRGIAVHTPSLLGAPTDVTVDLDVNPGDPSAFYQPTPRVEVTESDGRWYLSAPLLADQ